MTTHKLYYLNMLALVLSYIFEIIEMLETQIGFKLKRYRTDGGREYFFFDWMKVQGVTREPTSRDSPQPNPGERLNCTVWDRIRPMMVSFDLSFTFLPRAVQHAVHIRILMPSSGRTVATHYSMFGNNIDVSRLREFGYPKCILLYSQLPLLISLACPWMTLCAVAMLAS